jgi:hypothetical protein
MNMDPIEATSQLENEAVEAMAVLVDNYGYTFEDLMRLAEMAAS